MDNNKIIKRKVRNAYMISTVSISLVLFLLGAVGYLIFTALAATNQMKENIVVNVMLKNNSDSDDRNALKKALEKHPSVKSIEFISKERAAKEFKEYVGSDFEEFLSENPLPDVYEVKLKAETSTKEDIAALEKDVMKNKSVEEVLYQKNIIERISSNINKFNMVLLLFGASLLVISLILLNNTIRITIFSKRYIINTMKLVGATRWFIMRPFLRSGILQGIYAGFIACVMFFAMVAGLHEGLPEVNFIAAERYMLIIMGTMFLCGIAISLIFTTFAVSKYIKMNSNNIHIY